MSAPSMLEFMKSIAFAGADDGYDSMKTMVAYKGAQVELRNASFISPGKPSRGATDGSETDLFGYSTIGEDGETVYYTVGEDQANLIKTNKRDFMTSAAARVLLYHNLRMALAKVGYNGTDPVYVYTGLPVQTYWIGNKPNKAVIGRKLDNIKAPGSADKFVTPLDMGAGPMPNIVKISVFPEAICAWYSFAARLDKDMCVEQIPERASLKIVVVDIGGRTIDIVPMHRGSPDFDLMQSIHDKGAIYLTSIVERQIKTHRHDIDYLERLSYSDFRSAMITGVLKVFGHEFDVTEQVARSVAIYREEVSPLIFSALEGMTSYTHVLFAGGAIDLIIDGTPEKWAPRLLTIIKEDDFDVSSPFMNAYGLLLSSVLAGRSDYAKLESKSA